MKNDKDLRKVFERYEKLLFKAADSAKEETVYGYKTEFYKKVDEATQTFKQLAKRYIDKAVPEAALSSAAEAVLLSAGAYHETANVKLTTYVQMVSKLTQSARQFKDRIQARIDGDVRNGVTTTITSLKDYIKTELQSGGGIKITYSNGAEMPTDKYAKMLARTTRTETHNIAMVGKALDDGNDLVECSTVTPTCDLCALYQGRIYSISGNTPGYPKLYETAFRHGYSIIHPNCRHQFFPYNPKFHTAEERRALEEGTRRPWIGKQQGEREREAYAKSQMQMRKWNKELNEFDAMQRKLGENAPYKTIGAFRRAYRSEEGTLAYAKSHNFRSDTIELEDIQKVLGAERTPQTLDKLQNLKYNNNVEYELLKREKKTISYIKGKQWTTQFKTKAIDTYYEFRKDGIELTDHGVARLLSRFVDKKNEIKVVCKNKPFNYLQNDGKRIKHYDKIAIIYAKDTNEVVSFIEMKKPKTDWSEYDNSSF